MLRRHGENYLHYSCLLSAPAKWAAQALGEVISNLRQVHLVGATKFTSPTLAARESKDVTLAFAVSLVQEEMPEVRIHAQQAIYITQLRKAGHEH